LISISEFLDDGTLLSVSGFPFGKSMKSSRSADSILPTDADRGLDLMLLVLFGLSSSSELELDKFAFLSSRIC